VTTPVVRAAPTSGTTAELKKLKEADNLTEARARGLEALKTASGEEKKAIEEFLGEIAAPLVFSKRPMPEKVDCTVTNGDSLALLAKRYGTTVDTIRKGNNLPGQVIRLGTRLRILTGKFSMVVSKEQNTLTLLLNDQFFKRYHVGTGQYATTPTGQFKITGKVAQPTWYRPDGKSIPYGDKENLLGTHWMSIDVPGFGIHGTWQPETIGKQSSQGCVRLLNSDIEELFTLVPEGTPVIIQD
jgi:lipoprotein-anchoring transpeptidase ErfK/SrfK